MRQADAPNACAIVLLTIKALNRPQKFRRDSPMQGVRADIVWLTSAPMLLRRVDSIPPGTRARRDNLDAQHNPHAMVCRGNVRTPA